MKYKSKVISNIDSVSNQLKSLKNMTENNNISKDLLLSELNKLSNRLDDISEMISLEDDDFSVLRNGLK